MEQFLKTPQKKSLFVDEQSKIDDILLTASNALLSQRIAETSRKKYEFLVRKAAIEKDLVNLWNPLEIYN